MAAIPLSPDTELAIEFLDIWWPGGPWNIVAIDPIEKPDGDKNMRRAFCRTREQLRLFITEYNGRWNLYWSPNPTIPNCRLSPLKTEITCAITLHIDLDLAKGSAGSTEEYDELLSRIKSFDIQPTVILFSGGGYQAFWRFPVGDERPPGQYEQIEEVNINLGTQINADKTHNINRIMRLPGTINVLNAKKREAGRQPALATIVEVDWDRRWSFAKDPLPGASWQRPEPPPNDASDDADNEYSDFDINDQQPHDLDHIPAKLKKLIIEGDTSPKAKQDRSGFVLHIACSLLRLKWDQEEIKAVLLNPEYKVSAHCLDQQNPGRAADRAIAAAQESVKKDFIRGKNNAIAHIPKNYVKAIKDLGINLTYDQFSEQYWINDKKELTADELSSLRFRVDEKFDFLPTFLDFNACAYDLARKRSFHPVRDHINALVWDRKPRLDTWLIEYCGVDDTPYTRAVGKLTLIAGVRRIRQPGVKFDTMLVLVNPVQGTWKSAAVEALAIKREWYSDALTLPSDDKKTIEQTTGKWIIEFGELKGMKENAVEYTKHFLQKTFDSSRLAFGAKGITKQRQMIFIGTTNSTMFLTDSQNRRYWPVAVGIIKIDELRQAVEQLWAEAAAYEANGVSVELAPELWEAAAEAQNEYRQSEPWAEILDEALGNMNGRIRSIDAWKFIDKPGGQRRRDDDQRMAEAMREIGFIRKPKLRGFGSRNGLPSYHRGPLTDMTQIFAVRDITTGIYKASLEQPADYDPDEVEKTQPF